MTVLGYGPTNPPRGVTGEPSRLTEMEVATVNSDGTVDLRALTSRSSRFKVPVVCEYSPTIGDRVVVADLNGDAQTPAVVAVLTCAEPILHTIAAAGEPAYENNWIAYDADRPAGFYRHRGRVYLQGLVKNGTGPTIFTLPAAYRPPQPASLFFASVSNLLFGAVSVNGLTGAVAMAAGTNTWLSLAGISFRA